MYSLKKNVIAYSDSGKLPTGNTSINVADLPCVKPSLSFQPNKTRKMEMKLTRKKEKEEKAQASKHTVRAITKFTKLRLQMKYFASEFAYMNTEYFAN